MSIKHRVTDASKARFSRRAAIVAGSVGVGAGLAGCYEDPAITVHEPGEYKGSSDDLANAAEREQALAARFQAGQTDR